MTPSVLMRGLLSIACAGSALLVSVCPAAAQAPRPERPYRGIFASGGTEDAEQSLIANGSLGGGFDNNVVADALFGDRSRPTDVNTSSKGAVGQGAGSLSYSLNLNAISVGASGGTTVHYYPSLESKFLRRYYANVGTSIRLSRYLSVNTAASYMPYSASSFFPLIGTQSQEVVPDIDFASSLEHFVSYSAGVDYQRRLSQRTSLSADYGYRLRESSAFAQQFKSHTAGGRLTFDVGKGLALRAGYHYSETDYGLRARRFKNHQIDAGVNYNRALSFSRRTTLSFSTGTSATSRPDDDLGGIRYRATGGAELNHEIGRTWHAALGYARGVHLDDTWGDIVSSDSVSATFEGLFSRRLQFQSSARASTGAVGFSRADNGFDSYYGNASLGYALGRHVSVGLTYAYYRHRFDRAITLPMDFAHDFNRHSVRASVSLWAPLFQRTRRPNASR